MTTTAHAGHSPARADRFGENDCDLSRFAHLVGRTTELDDYPYAAEVRSQVLFYDAARLEGIVVDPRERAAVQDELARALLTGPGIVVIAGAFDDRHALDETSRVYREVIDLQRNSGTAHGDHFARPGANDRIWNALGRLAGVDPELFVRYYSNDMLALVSEAWLGPMYQVTSAINVVNPGGAAQSSHRDYHLGFMATETAVRFRAHIHRLTAALTLQGAVAHVDMPVESGPTMYLPYSHQFEAGYLAVERPEFREFFAENRVQLALAAGDAVFFNPALHHAAGHNTTGGDASVGIHRMANLLQVSSAFGRAMESIDRERLCGDIYPALQRFAGTGSRQSVRNVIAAAAEGYAFPSNLDLDIPTAGLAGETPAELMTRALDTGMDDAWFVDELSALGRRHLP
ncbi:phytanoyl-CoA dioxygenase family protein [Williamsia maris]|uniref:Phytanoyl-CoA dioxygenase (PhyH) n=1 Tax=Williamsia maris TaxID=72806 RepID=A0ABT1HGX7_9NOCA|nr:phytanoyl-CoA dioxygenase family protein [Williamsia maris]MCP2177508.1 Phytanoyl-CoA dioxygenase (PhyH) [Williamsia maris]